ncbi:MAG: hypothetical protein KJS74_10805 [Rhodospirillales bacterium]|nr:hypothetical protein [Rhodospirillales bacterium]
MAMERDEMFGRHFAASWLVLAAASLGGCSQSVGLYHETEGGAIAQSRQAPPGANLPYPNLADVPAPQEAAAPGAQAAITAQARGGVSAPSPGALAGLALPSAVPPLPNVPGLMLSSPSVVPATPLPPMVVKPPAPPPAPPVGVAFAPGSALLPYSQAERLQGAVAQRGGAHVRAVGFGDGSMALALARARRLADALTADGVPAQDIEVNAFAAGSGGFVQLVY